MVQTLLDYLQSIYLEEQVYKYYHNTGGIDATSQIFEPSLTSNNHYLFSLQPQIIMCYLSNNLPL